MFANLHACMLINVSHCHCTVQYAIAYVMYALGQKKKYVCFLLHLQKNRVAFNFFFFNF